MKKKLKVLKISLSNKKYGGYAYENDIVKVLDKHLNIETVDIIQSSKLSTLLTAVEYFIKAKLKTNSYVLLNFTTIPFFSLWKGRNIVVIHHIDWSQCSKISSIYQSFCLFILRLNKKRWKKIVVVSEYWAVHLENLGFDNIEIIHNSIELPKNLKPRLNCKEIKEKYNLPSQQFIYLGNPQKGKGWQIAFNLLSKLNYIFILTGITDQSFKNTEYPEKVQYLNLTYDEYLQVISCAECSVLLSQFKEGWNRTAHESLLLGTPVIGSGTGGMKELLKNAGQPIFCKSKQDLVNILKEVLANRATYAEKGVEGIRKYTFEAFEKKWLNYFSKNALNSI